MAGNGFRAVSGILSPYIMSSAGNCRTSNHHESCRSALPAGIITGAKRRSRKHFQPYEEVPFEEKPPPGDRLVDTLDSDAHIASIERMSHTVGRRGLRLG